MKYKWYFKCDAEKYTDVVALSKFLGNNARLEFLPCHVISGSDTSYFYQTKKVRTFKKALMQFFRPLENREFIWSDIYTYKAKENYIKTRNCLNKSFKSKSSMSLSLDLSSVVQFIKRAYYQAYVWFHGYG